MDVAVDFGVSGAMERFQLRTPEVLLLQNPQHRLKARRRSIVSGRGPAMRRMIAIANRFLRLQVASLSHRINLSQLAPLSWRDAFRAAVRAGILCQLLRSRSAEPCRLLARQFCFITPRACPQFSGRLRFGHAEGVRPQSVLRYSMIALRSSGNSAGPITPGTGLSLLYSFLNSWPLFQFPRIEVSNSKPLVIGSVL